MRTSESTTALIAALVKARPAFKPVLREAVGQVGQNREYRYADLSALLEATVPALTAQGLAVLQAVDAETSSLITRLAHISGEWAEAAYPLNLDLPPQQFGSSLTYGRRYSLQALLCLAAEDDDAQAVEKAPKPKAKTATPINLITEAQRKRMFAIAQQAGWTHDQMKGYFRLTYGVESTKDLPASRYDQVCQVFAQPPAAVEDLAL